MPLDNEPELVAFVDFWLVSVCVGLVDDVVPLFCLSNNFNNS